MAKRHNGEGSIYPYRNGFSAHVWITTPEGRRQRKSVYGKTREEVHAKWLKLHGQAGRGPVAPRVPKLEDFLDGWLTDVVRAGLAPATAANYELFVRPYIVPDLGAKKVDKLTVRDVQVWLNALRTRCQCCAQGKDAARPTPRCCAAGKCCHKVASDWTVHQAWMVLRGAMTAAMREELVSRNVTALVRVPVPRPQKPATWTVDEARRFLESARADGDPLYAGYVLMLVLGLRRGELLGLGWEDIDLGAEEAYVRWQVQRVKGRAAPSAHEDRGLGGAAPAAGDLREGARAASGYRGSLAAVRGGVMGGFRAGADDHARGRDRPAELPQVFQGARCQGRCAGRLSARDPSNVRLTASRARRPPEGCHGDPPAQQDRRDDGHLLSGVLGLDATGSQAAWQPARGGIGMTPVAVLFWGTDAKGATPCMRKWRLTCVEPRGLEPLTPCLQSRCATNCAKAPFAGRSGLVDRVGGLGPESLLLARLVQLLLGENGADGSQSHEQELLHGTSPRCSCAGGGPNRT